MVWLNTDPLTDNSYASLDFAVYCAGGVLIIFESGVNVGNFGSYVAGDNFAVQYDGKVVRYYHNGGLFHTTLGVASGLKFFLDTSFFSSGASAILTSFAAAGSAGTDGTNGINGTNGTNGTNGAQGANAVGFVQDATPGAGTYVGQMWYAPTPKRINRWDGAAWQPMLGVVAALDTIGASNIIVANLQALSANIGTLQTATTGARVVISDNLIQGFYANNGLAFRLGVF